MAGKYTPGVSEVLSGVYTYIKAAASTAISAGARGVVAYPFTSDWGPVNTLLSCTIGEFEKTYNVAATTLSANKVYKHAVNGRPRRILAYRMATTDAKTATCTLDNNLKLETLYPTSRKFAVTVKDAVMEGYKTIEIVENGVVLVTTTVNTVADLVTQLNRSDYVRVTNYTAEIEALPGDESAVEFTGGSDGSEATATQYTAFLAELENDGTANAFSLDGVSDTAIITSVVAWLKRVRDEGVYITFVTGGTAAWDTDTAAANTVSRTYNYRGIINVGNGVDNYTAADMAIFIAARVAAVALNATLTDETVPYTAVNKTLGKTEREVAKQSGTLLFVKSGDYVEIDEDVNTLTKPTADEHEYFGSIRVSNALDYVAHDLEVFGNEYKKTKSNTTEARQCYAANVETEYLQPLIHDEVLREGCYYQPDPEYHGEGAIYNPAIDEAFFVADITPVESMKRVYQKLNVTF